MFIEVGFLSYIINRFIGIFPIKHPIDSMSDYINSFKERFYQDTISQGAILSTTLILITLGVVYLIDLYIGYMTNFYVKVTLLSIISSMMISSKVSDKSILTNGVVAPLFYLILFGIEGPFVYKAIETLNSMVAKDGEFGKVSLNLYKIVNYIPSYITSIFKDKIIEDKSFQKRLDISIVAFFIIALLINYFISK